ncbi:MAG: F0F1 ATP synthase subunit B [Epsilonproteobacteria bacterium]|nr:F0F1 ATP synthase subunit B [Campylobacterota bacterium]NPA56673.1 F0F1 ATP synthase subunit B [Campylobacterota bacterium]
MLGKKLTRLGLLSITLLASTAMASEGGGGTDFIPRTVNFLIFAAILYYLVAEPVKNFFKNRSEKIAKLLEEVQTKLKEARLEKERAEQELEKAQAFTKEIQQITEKEIEVIVKHIKEQIQEELEVLEKSFQENRELERRKRIRQITQEVLERLFEDKDLNLDKSKFVTLIVKKVA